jgi:kynureninase
VLEASYRHQVALLAAEVDALDLPEPVLTRDRATPLGAIAGFLAVESPHAEALQQALAEAGVASDSRGRYLRLGPAPYLSDDQLREAVARLGSVAGEVVAKL